MYWEEEYNNLNERTWTNGNFHIVETKEGYDLYENESYCNTFPTLEQAKEEVEN